MDIFYLYLLIVDKKNEINYNFSIEYIRNIYNNMNENYNNKYKLIMISKIIIELINNYRGANEIEESQNKELNKIIDKSKEIIKNNINILKDIKLEINEKDIIQMNIDKIYIYIIKSLIIERKFENYEYTYNIINELELEKINITKIMFEELFQILNSNNNYINDYIILKEKDLYDEKKINFYYILLKFILKNSILS